MSELAIFNSSAKDFEFLGFYFNGHHSSEFNLTVVTPSNLNQENLFADFEDKIVNVNGREGSYYFGTKFKTRSLSLTLAFDDLNSVNKRNIINWLNPKIVSKLFLDESPYKYYWVKIAAPPAFSFVPFETVVVNGSTTTKTHIFKGTIDIELLATDPFAYSECALLSDVYVLQLSEGNYVRQNNVYDSNNIPGWHGESGLHMSDPVLPKKPLAKANIGNGYTSVSQPAGTWDIDFYNGGTVETPISFSFIIGVFNIGTNFELTNTTQDPNEVFQLKSLKNISALAGSTGTWKIICQPDKGLIIGASSVDNYVKTYNLGAIHNGVWLQVYPGTNILDSSHTLTNLNISYKYKYL